MGNRHLNIDEALEEFFKNMRRSEYDPALYQKYLVYKHRWKKGQLKRKAAEKILLSNDYIKVKEDIKYLKVNKQPV